MEEEMGINNEMCRRSADSQNIHTLLWIRPGRGEEEAGCITKEVVSSVMFVPIVF